MAAIKLDVQITRQQKIQGLKKKEGQVELNKKLENKIVYIYTVNAVSNQSINAPNMPKINKHILPRVKKFETWKQWCDNKMNKK